MVQHQWRRCAAASVAGLAVLLVIAGAVQWAAMADSPKIARFDRAEFVASSARRPPGDAAAWKTVDLPDEWRSRSNTLRAGWYRIKFWLDSAPTGLQYALVHNRRAQRVAVWVNGARVSASRETNAEATGRAGSGADAPVSGAILPHLLKAGENVMHVRMEGSSHPAKVHGLGRVYFGDARSVRRVQIWLNELGINTKREATVMALAAGIITLFLWLARRSDRVMLWFSIACLSWGTLGLVYMKLRWEGAFQATGMLYFSVTYGLVVPTVVLSLRTVELNWPRREALLWLFLLFELSYPLWPGQPWAGALLAWDAVNVALLLGAALIVFYAAQRPIAWPTRLQLAALATMAAFMGFEIARYLGWVPVESPRMRHYHVPLMLLAMGAACFDRHALAVRRTERMNIELEQRVAEKTREMEVNHAQIDAAERENTLVKERQRILADMHDGLGATLVGVLRHVRAGNADARSVRTRILDALQEMRAAVGALQPHGGDLAAVLGNLRERLDGLIAGSGIRLVWRVDELSGLGAFPTSDVMSLQRIVLEAVGNVLKHSDASEFRFIARARDGGDVEIRVEDNGRGFDPALAHAGLGLGNMRARAERIGATLEVFASSGEGTTVRLVIPSTLLARTPDRADSALKPAAAFVSTARTGMIVMAAAMAVVLAGYPQFTSAASSPRVIRFDQAELVRSSATRPPGDSAPWQPVSLPDQWRYRPQHSDSVWYRIRFNLKSKRSGLQSILVLHRRAYGIAFFVNGKLVGTARDFQSMSGSKVGGQLGSPVRHNFPANMVRPGKNVIYARMAGSDHPALLHGLGQVYFGDARPVRQIYYRSNELNFAAKREFTFMMLAAGLIALFMWFARKGDRVMFWFSVACLSWGTGGLAYMMWRWSDWTAVSDLLLFHGIYGLVVPTLILSLRSVDLKWPRVEAGLWLFFAVELSYPLWAEHWPSMHFVWNAANSGLLLVALGIILYAARRPLRWPTRLQIVALATMAVVMSYEIVRYLGWVDVESPEIRHFHVPLMLVAMGAACFERYARSTREAERTTAELEQQIAEKVQEIEANHVRVEEAARQRALAQERQRILADMHEGLGDNLVRLLEYIDSGRAERSGIEQRVEEALREMRVAIDALQPHGGDLAAVLGGLRERLDGLVAGSGVRLVWQVDELPAVQELTPSGVFSLQRIVLEAVGNALKHGGTKQVRFIACAREDGDIEIRIEDDGHGFDPAKTRDGRGLLDMRVRARRLGAALNISSQPGRGAVVRLTVHRTVMERASGSGESRPVAPAAPAVQPA